MSAPAASIGPLSTRLALGGEWTTGLTLWAVLFIPALGLSAYQNVGQPFPTLLAGAIASLAPCVAVIIVFLFARFLRRSVSTIPVALCVVFWVSIGAVHGAVAALMSTVLTGSPPHYAAYIIFWAASCLIWLPLVTYAVAQSAYRQRLLTSVQLELRRDRFLRRSSLLEISDLRELIVTAIQHNLRPVIIEIQRGLASLSPGRSGAQFAELGRQLSDVSEETTRIIDTTVGPAAYFSPADDPIPSTPVAAGLDFHQSRPLMAAALTSVALLPVVVDVSFSLGTVTRSTIEATMIVIAVIFVLLSVGLAAQRFVRESSRRVRIVAALIAYAVAGLAASAVAIFGPWQPPGHENIVLAVLLPVAVPLSTFTLSAAVGLGNANIGLVHQIADLRDGIARFKESLEEDRSTIRAQLSALTHGPLRGRLSACAMALNFHAAELKNASPERTEYILASVREHLADVLTELDSLG